jgi:outer membrane protein assembly factor BamB
MSVTMRVYQRIGMCLLLLAFGGLGRAADWPNWRGPNHNGISSEKDWTTDWPDTGPKTLWKASIGIGFASMAVSQGRVYAMGNTDDTDTVYCFEAETGAEVWKKSYPCPLYPKMHEGGPAATPTVDGSAVYTFSKDGDIIRFDAAAGEVVWHKNLNKELGLQHPTWYFASSPLVVDDMVVLNAGSQGIALNKSDGSVKWQNGTGPAGYGTPVSFQMGDRRCLAMFVAKAVVGVAADAGQVLWEIPWETQSDIQATDPVISDGKLFASSGYNVGCGLFDISSGVPKEIYRNADMRNQFNSSVLWEGHLYGFDGQIGMRGVGGGQLTCMEYATGQVKWSQGGMGTGSLMLADGKLIVLSEAGKLVIAEASPNGYKELASAEILEGRCWTVPVLANGRICARNAAGDLVCVDVRSKS